LRTPVWIADVAARFITWLVLCIGAASATASASDTLFFDDFQNGTAVAWSAGGDGVVDMNRYQGNVTLKLTKTAYAVSKVPVSGYRRIQAGGSFAAADLEGDDRCLLQVSVDDGQQWTTVNRVVDGQDDGITLHGGGQALQLPDGTDEILLIARIAGNGDNDTCWLDNVFVVAANGGSASASPRTLSKKWLLGDAPFDAPVRMSEFAMPDDAAPPDGDFNGVLTLQPEAAGLNIVLDAWGRVDEFGDAIRRLPAFAFEFAQDGHDLVPLERGVIRRQHPYWEYILLPGKVWREKGDRGWNRAALPFALQERAANCTHNGVMTWLFDDDGKVSTVAYQVTAETCGYLKLDLWGRVAASFLPTDLGDRGAAAIAAAREHRERRLPVRPIEALAERYPAIDPLSFGIEDGISPRDMSVFGLFVDGIHYRSDCFTRTGAHPYCDSFPLSSYSTAKSIFAGVATMRAERLVPGISQTRIADVVDACDGPQWSGVSIENALDMATGNYASTASSEDEDSPPHVRFIFDDTHASKIDFACSHFRRGAEPGTQFVYHTSDTYLVGTALANALPDDVDIYTDLVDGPLWRPLGLSPLLSHTKRTYDERAQPFTGYGLTYEADDIVRIARWLNTEHAKIDGEPMLDTDMLAATLQRDPDDVGLPAGTALRYNNGFWAYDAGPSLGCSQSAWVPFMSGVSGITVALFPNDVIYYYYSDSYVYRWQSGREAAHAIARLCE
jgi:hypothetical protein